MCAVSETDLSRVLARLSVLGRRKLSLAARFMRPMCPCSSVGCARAFVAVGDSSWDLCFDRFWLPCIRGRDQIPASAGRALWAAGGTRNLVPSPEAGRPKSVDKEVPGAVSDCYQRHSCCSFWSLAARVRLFISAECFGEHQPLPVSS